MGTNIMTLGAGGQDQWGVSLLRCAAGALRVGRVCCPSKGGGPVVRRHHDRHCTSLPRQPHLPLLMKIYQTGFPRALQNDPGYKIFIKFQVLNGLSITR